MHLHALPILFALFVWWFSTGAIIFLDGLPRRTFRWSMIGASVVLVISLWGLARSSADATVTGAYCAFATGLLAWGWQEISFYMGFVTGPRSAPCPEGCRGWRHFGHAIQTSLWHELAIIASAIVVVALTWGQPNQVGMWTFMVLWWMHQSAKLNVFLGVRNLNEEFLPEHLRFLKSFLTKKPMNLLFPISVTASTVIATWLLERAFTPGLSAFATVGFTFLGTMMVLAILEHWFLVLPLPASALWRWGLSSRGSKQTFEVEVVAGFLGAGKTTFMRRLLTGADPDSRTVVLVNDFSSVGVDGSRLAGRGAEVVELPNGCICCSLRRDLGRQLQQTVARWAPRRVLIEPSGVADLASLLSALHQPDLTPLISRQRVRVVIDAGAFLRDYARMGPYFEAQAPLADELIVNKTDLVSAAELRTVAQTLHGLGPQAAVLAARFGIVQPGALDDLLLHPEPHAAPAPKRREHDAHEHHHHAHGHGDHAHEHHEDAFGLRAWSMTFDGPCDAEVLHDVLLAIARGAYGEVERAKGLARTGGGWVSFDVASGRPSMAAFAAREGEAPRVIAIGREMDESRLAAAFAACVLPDDDTAGLGVTRAEVA